MSQRKSLKNGKKFKQISEEFEDLISYVQDFSSFLPIAVCSISPNGSITEINRAFEGLTGYKPSEAIGKQIKTLFLQEDGIETIIKEVTIKKIIRNRELTLILKDKNRILTDISVSAREDKKGNLIGYFISIIDITEIKKLQESLEEQVEKRTKELKNKINELEKFQKITVGRELKMVELKNEVMRLKNELANKRSQ